MTFNKNAYRYKKKRGIKRRKKGKRVSSVPKQIQCANYIPKNRLIRFKDFRSFVMTDNATPDIGGGTHVAHVPNLQMSANSPYQAFVIPPGSTTIGNTGQWWSQSGTADNTPSKGQSVPSLSLWLTNQAGEGDGFYRTAQCLGAKLTVSAVPLSSSVHDTEDTGNKQDVVKMVVQTSTQPDHFANKRINEEFNSEKISQLANCKTANIYSNFNGTPRGATITQYYSFKKMNATEGRSAYNTFSNDSNPGERDYFQLLFLPCDNEDYGAGASDTSVGQGRIPNMRVSIKIEYLVLLSEPNNTTIGLNNNKGNVLPSIPMRDTTDL